VRDAEFHGTTVPAGSTLLCLVGAGNRDESKFSDGDRFDIHRTRAPHLTFGHGIHVCLGNALARLEGRVALDELLNRFPEWDVDLSRAHLSATSTVRGWETLPAYTPSVSGARSARLQSEAKLAPKQTAPAALPNAEIWKITMSTPAGPQEMTAHIVRQGNTFSGRIDSPMGSQEISNGVATGNALNWVMAVKKPMPLKIVFDVRIDGGEMEGKAKLGMFGTGSLTGVRIS
jgi:hypothetical protein